MGCSCTCVCVCVLLCVCVCVWNNFVTPLMYDSVLSVCLVGDLAVLATSKLSLTVNDEIHHILVNVPLSDRRKSSSVCSPHF